ncbi:hypothetical protein EYZ11_005382 [Aspergillus tanneri]|uniref:Uncharacterized protein n=1 Tax=Aspergillus tanneri TaxID=1220188 RepID=A0A4S3JI20_9EURO|nr:hypothetical protein EYZ11_005382 [Aspergillus tanneri]
MPRIRLSALNKIKNATGLGGSGQ